MNELAKNLRKTKEYDEIRLLCSENGISAETAEKFIKGERLHLAEAAVHEDKTEGSDITEEAAGRIKEGLLLPVNQEPKKVYTVEDVRKKLEEELKIYKDGDSKYVVDQLIKLCDTDEELLSAIMLPHKSYDKAFQYFYKQSRNVGYKMPHGNMVYLDNDKAVELSVEYFKRDDAAEEKKKLEKEVTRKENAKKRKTTEVSKTAVVKKEADIPRQEIGKKKNEMDGQLTLFDL